nr:immunoglobulin light chain junction region [Macaca mulatta]MOX69929.1 immunoglobulin light chain junction region [Macaca mulatta]MOX70264.1 immunoglobulin light chain junction region [Macaca mulatta]MOX71721.1 immunoglobulin light chain junction region [Macaca mulatta]MOX72345.1 immunoglobulin light chain junction region [Macaca mulatta]
DYYCQVYDGSATVF